MLLNRRIFALSPLFMSALPFKVVAEEMDVERHGMSYFGDLAMPASFKHFPSVNPNAPKGGTLSYVPSQWGYNQSPETFNSFNTFILRGDAPANMERIFASLMAGSSDEPSSLYGFVAQSVTKSEGGKVLRFRLRKEAQFHDGTRITAQDVAWTFMTLKEKGHPSFGIMLTDMKSVEAEGDDLVKVTLVDGASRELPLVVAGLPILSKAYYEKVDFSTTTLEPPLGSGAYKIGKFEAGRFVEYERVKGWWGETLPVNVGIDNFDIIRVECFRDREVAFEAFKSRNYLFREEFTSRTWATQYDFPAVKEGKVKLQPIDTGLPAGVQALYINTRRDKFKDRRVREAIILAFDFEFVNQNVMYNAYQRLTSFFDNSTMKAEGKPSAAELKLLEPFRGKVPDEVFGEPWLPPVSDGSGQDRTLLRKATQLLKEAGLNLKDGKLLDAKGEQMTIEFLDYNATFERHLAPWIANLKRLGIEANIRRVDPAQFQSRMKEFDFDIVSRAYTPVLTPGEGLKLSYSSAAAKTSGNSNNSGIADPAIDAVLDVLTKANSREEMEVAARALDRLLRAGRYVIPAWFKKDRWYVTWDVYGRPDTKPRFGTGAPSTWWWDKDKAAKLGL